MEHDFSRLSSELSKISTLVERELDRRLPKSSAEPKRLHAAVRHAIFAGGKRLRPALCFHSCVLCGGAFKDALPAACALEMIHTYSLIHDDLPAMDDDVLRRGKPTVHVAFDETTAILAGDALLTEAFGTLAETKNKNSVPAMVRLLSGKAGFGGMVAGQQWDIEAGKGDSQRLKDLKYISKIHLHKTACLLQASAILGAMAAGAPAWKLKALETYGECLGMAFQIADDVLDATSTPEELGKTPGKDVDQNKATYVAALGIEGARKEALKYADKAICALRKFGDDAWFLRDLAWFAADRKK